MKNQNNQMIIKIIYRAFSLVILLTGLFFSYLIAELNDAPGMVIIGSTLTGAGALLIYGIGEIITELKENNKVLLSLQKELTNKKK